MNSTQLKRVVCGVALVSLSAIPVRPASAQTGNCSGGGDEIFLESTSEGSVFAGSESACVGFDQGPQTVRVDFSGNHSFKVIVNALQPFSLQIQTETFAPPGPPDLPPRYPDSSEVCIPYVNATPTTLGDCALYTVTAFDGNGVFIPPEDEHLYFSGKIIYRIAWNFPTLGGDFDNPRGLRAPTEFDPFVDITTGVFPLLQSGEDPAVDSSADGFSQYIVVQQAHNNVLLGCQSPLDCSNPSNPSLNVFNAGQTVPLKIVVPGAPKSADIRLTVSDSSGNVFLGESAGRSNTDNEFRRTGNNFQFNWSTKGLAPGVYLLTFSPGTDSGDLFAPQSIQVTLR